MSRRKVPSPARLLVSVIYREERDFDRSLRTISGRLGTVARISDPFPFDRTEYYEREMGAPLFRRFLLATEAVSRDELAAAKLTAEAIENEFLVNGKRTVNIDPGLLTDENVVLATGKNYSHRIYLHDGVFADLTLVFEKGEYGRCRGRTPITRRPRSAPSSRGGAGNSGKRENRPWEEIRRCG